MTERETLEFDALIVGAGPAGLSAAIRLKQIAQARGREWSVCVIEKGAEVGAHILSGAVIEPRALDELIPDWRERNSPLETPAQRDRFWLLTERRKFALPTPPQMNNEGNFIVSLGKVARWLGQEAEAIGAEIFPGFAAANAIVEDGIVRGVVTGDMGIGKDGKPTANFSPGVNIRARYTLLAEGCRGSVTRALTEQFNLRKDCAPQTYGIGVKELWEVEKTNPGDALHTIGWPLDSQTYGGSFLYHLDSRRIALGFVVGLDYQNPHLSPYRELQRFKHHPAIAPMLKGGKRIAYGARALNEGGWQSIPQLSFDGGLLIGAAAGFMNVAKIKGTHTAMKSGILAAETVADALDESPPPPRLIQYDKAVRESWINDELHRVRNIRPIFRHGLWIGLAYAAADSYLLRGHAPWTFKHHSDHKRLRRSDECRRIEYPKPDGKLSFDLTESVAFANVYHEENQPAHLTLQNSATPIDINLARYGAPETLYCPAGVYEIIENGGGARLQINAQNCVHCKTCDIKDPTQNIRWIPPEGGGGPNYAEM